MKSKLLQPAVFLDRDGTLIEDRGHLGDPGEVFFYPETLAALRRLQKRFRLFIVTHQPGIAAGILPEPSVRRVNEHVVAELRRGGVRITAVYCCPHGREEGCACIKPEPFFPEEAAAQYGLDLSRSFAVGDHPHDVFMGRNAGGEGIYVLSGHGLKHHSGLPEGITVVPGITEAADWMLAAHAMDNMEKRHPGRIMQAAAILHNGGIVAFPTETVYGLGAVVFNENAVAKLFAAKHRPRFDPLIVHVAGPRDVTALAARIPVKAKALMERFWPGPLTLVLPKTARVPDLVTAGLSTVAVRMPRHPMALSLIGQAGAPLAAPSANRFGRTSPTRAGHVSESLRGKPDMVLNGGPSSIGIESTVIACTGRQPVLLRSGGLPLEAIESVVGPVARVTAAAEPRVAAPGMLPRHYAPRTPLYLRNRIPRRPEAGRRVGMLAFRGTAYPGGFAAVEILSRNGDLREAASNLFNAMRRLDRCKLDFIIAERVPDTGLGAAINDRLSRAAAKLV